ncbi:extensin-like [Glossina fuscipes]|uniref:Extensin-like n=1 Tax=Glossina fuscipes TaxID=7396 RepID=A0A8U0WHG1_9MUSC|nr:extensin-like [Glossina fuscipes]
MAGMDLYLNDPVNKQQQLHPQYQQQARSPLNLGFPPELGYGYPMFQPNQYPLQPPTHFGFNPLPLYPPLYPGLGPFFNHFPPPPTGPNPHPPLPPPIIPIPPRRTTRMEAPFMPSQFIGFALNDDRRHPPDHAKGSQTPSDTRTSNSAYAMPLSKPVYETQSNSPNGNVNDPYPPNNNNNLIYMSPNYTYGLYKNN